MNDVPLSNEVVSTASVSKPEIDAWSWPPSLRSGNGTRVADDSSPSAWDQDVGVGQDFLLFGNISVVCEVIPGVCPLGNSFMVEACVFSVLEIVSSSERLEPMRRAWE